MFIWGAIMEIAAFMQHFGIGPSFLGALSLGEDFSASVRQAGAPGDLAGIFGDKWKQLSYTLGTNQRGRRLIQRIDAALPRKLPRSGKALDVGCGYGGTLIGFHELGLEPTGIDLEARLTRISEANTADAKCNATIKTVDAFRHFESGDRYDLIVMNDVIEHLNDPDRAISLATKALNSGGVLAIYAPNGKHPAYATKDPHNGVFGASALPRSLAMPLVKAARGVTHYGLGEYPSADWLTARFRDNQLRVIVDPTDYGETLHDLPKFMSELFGTWESASEIETVQDPILRREITAALLGYVVEICSGAKRSLVEGEQSAFVQRYLRRAWLVLGVRD
jgi:SAM-dependent methyltransferase